MYYVYIHGELVKTPLSKAAYDTRKIYRYLVFLIHTEKPSNQEANESLVFKEGAAQFHREITFNI